MNGEPVTILTGRDDPNDLEVLTSRLVAEKFKVLPVADRTATVTLARSEVPNLIVLDLKSCFDVYRSLKRNFVTEPVPIIALLFPAEEVDRVAALELGADDCLAKPFNFRELNLRIRFHWRERGIKWAGSRQDRPFLGEHVTSAIYGLALGYEDLNDHDSLRKDLL